MESFPKQVSSRVSKALGSLATKLFPETLVTPEYQQQLDDLSETLMERYRPESVQGELFVMRGEDDGSR